jgi:hypothetical protein
MQEGRMRVLVATLACAALFAGVASATATGDARSPRGPKILLLSYGEAPGEMAPTRRLEEYSRHTKSVRFSTTFKGERVTVPGVYRPFTTATDIHGRKAKHPWAPDRHKGGSHLISLVHRSLYQRGVAKVRVLARGHGDTDFVKFQIDLASDDCIEDPPLYPIDCGIPA